MGVVLAKDRLLILFLPGLYHRREQREGERGKSQKLMLFMRGRHIGGTDY